MLNIPPGVLMISPPLTLIMVNPVYRSTHDTPTHSSWYPPAVLMASSTVLNTPGCTHDSPQCTEHPPPPVYSMISPQCTEHLLVHCIDIMQGAYANFDCFTNSRILVKLAKFWRYFPNITLFKIMRQQYLEDFQNSLVGKINCACKLMLVGKCQPNPKR